MESKNSIKRVDEIVEIKVAEAIQRERENHMKIEQDYIKTRNRLRVSLFKYNLNFAILI